MLSAASTAIHEKGPSKAKVPPHQHEIKMSWLADNRDGDGGESSVEDNGQKQKLGQPHGNDTIVNEEQPCAALRRQPHDDHLNRDSMEDSDVPAQAKLSSEQGQTVTPGDTCADEYLGRVLASSLVDLQCIRQYRTSESSKGGIPYLEFECLMQDGRCYWVAEAEVQRAEPSVVGTFWGCGPEDWAAPETGEETGREAWKRPLATDDDGVPDADVILGSRTCSRGQIEFFTQQIGYPANQPTWHDEETVRQTCPQDYERFLLDRTNLPKIMNGESKLVAIVGHRLNGEKGSQKRIQLSCQWTNGTESWETEDKVQRTYNAAVLTYWQSDLKARSSCKVPNQRLRIVGHMESDSKLFLKVQMVGRSSCDSCVICGTFPCCRTSTCKPNLRVELVERLLWECQRMTEVYLKEQGLTSYGSRLKVKRRSKRLQFRRD